MKITFFGAAQEVTGSKYLLEVGDFKLLLDCGMHQGKRSVANELNRNFPIDAHSIDAMILSHAHADHCGMLPVLVRDGFEGNIYCTAATADIAKFILEDIANIQEQDAEHFNKHLPEGEAEIKPIYTQEDVKRVSGRFVSVPYFRLSHEWTQLAPGIRFKFYDAGHILGSAITLLEITENQEKKNLIFTGDLGRHFLPILRDPEFVQEPADILMIESTYGSRIHKPVADLEGELKTIITEAVKNKSKIVVPAFSLGRTQELLYVIHKLLDTGEIPSLPIFVDSPLAQKITRVFNTYTNDFDEEFWKDFGERGEKAFLFDALIVTASVKESQSINEKNGPFMVIAGSGMCEGGRILHHLKNNIQDENTVILITGYQGENTLGRKIIEGISPVKIFGVPYNVKAKVKILNELSAHADQKDLLTYIKHIEGLKKVFLVHGETKESSVLKDLAEREIPGIDIQIPSLKSSFEV
jgi:metallo-beta-lactamase family protein